MTFITTSLKEVLMLNCYLLTDSLTYEIRSEDVCEEFFKFFDLSNYPKDSKFFDPTNKKVVGKIKDLFKGKKIHEFVGLKSTMHSMKNIDVK